MNKDESYYCKYCSLFHHNNSRIYSEHQKYKAEVPKIDKKRKKSFWDRF